MKTLTVKMPAFLASALVNGDTSGLSTDDDFAVLDVALRYCAPGHVVDVGETHISRLCDLPGCTGDQHEVADYVVLYLDAPKVNS